MIPASYVIVYREGRFFCSLLHYRAPLRVDCASFAQHMCHDALTEGGVQCIGESTDFFPNPPSFEPWILWVPSEAFFVFWWKIHVFLAKVSSGSSFFRHREKSKKVRGSLKRSVFNAAQPALQKGSPFEVSSSDFLRTKIAGLAFFSTL